MKRYLKVALVVISFAGMMMSCGNIGKTTMNELTFTKGRAEEMIVTKGSKVYYGDFWSNDKKTVKMTTNYYGIIQSISCYHPDGKLAFYISLGSDGYLDSATEQFYDENGNKIDKEAWDKYESYFDAMLKRFVPRELRTL